MAKTRVPVPDQISVEVLFLHDHTCCICREKGKAVQIHHIDEDPSNNVPENLAVLCLQDHDDTQIIGGFSRKLNPSLVEQYRNDWLERIKKRREEADRIASERMGNAQAALKREVKWKRPPQQMLDAYIQHLPELLSVCFARARSEWDAGVNTRMRNATSELIDVLQSTLVYLATWYPPEHFGGQTADVYFSEYIASRYVWHRAINTPDEPASGGTMAGVLAGGGALDDVLAAISDIVAAQASAEFDFKSWSNRWKKAQERSNYKTADFQRSDGQGREPAPTPVEQTIDIRFDPQPPYETNEISHGRGLSTVRIGLKATGQAFSNCVVYIEKIAPEPQLPSGLPIRLAGNAPILRPDDPEFLIDVASQWDHVEKFRFAAPLPPMDASSWYIADDPSRLIEIKVKARSETNEFQKTALFKIWVDASKKLHLERR
jgi:hypothetical protein